jgi:3-methyladenine DNA glycosylase/8-oxoguanine DNA glycosylase
MPAVALPTPVLACRPYTTSVNVAATLAPFRHGRTDPTTVMRSVGRGRTSSGTFLHATHTPDGPGTVRVRWTGGSGDVDVDSFGTGGEWLAARIPRMLGRDDTGLDGVDTSAWSPTVIAALHASGDVAIGAGSNLYHELLPTIVEQRITGFEAHRQWRRLCVELGEAAPGPFPGLLLPPAPERLVGRPAWWFHPLGIERKRAMPLVEIARHPARLWEWSSLPAGEAAAMLRLLPGVGVWTVGTVLGTALGDPDAVAVGDYHLKNVVGYALAGEARATDERMLELLAPYAGQRGRVIRALLRHGHRAPKFGPRQRILPMSRW